jgi:hypothetical protein
MKMPDELMWPIRVRPDCANTRRRSFATDRCPPHVSPRRACSHREPRSLASPYTDGSRRGALAIICPSAMMTAVFLPSNIPRRSERLQQWSRLGCISLPSGISRSAPFRRTDFRSMDSGLSVCVRVRLAPMSGLSLGQGLVAAVKADTFSLTAWQIGMYGFMAVAHFLIFRAGLGRATWDRYR